MLNSRLTEITRQPDAPFAFASSSYGAFVRSTDVYFLSATVKDGGVQRGLEAILREARRVDQHGFLPAELDRAKASQLRSLESAYQERDKTESGNYAGEYINHFLTAEPTPGIAWEYETAKRVLPTVTLEDVNALGRAVDHQREPGGGGVRAHRAVGQRAVQRRAAEHVPQGGR